MFLRKFTDTRFHAEIHCRYSVFVQEEWEKCTLPQRTNDQGTQGNLIFRVNSGCISYLVHYDTLSQNATAVFFIKHDKKLLQHALDFLVQNAAVLSQIATVITNCVDFITKCDSFYEMRRYKHFQ